MAACKIQEPQDKPFRGKSDPSRERERKDKNAVNSDHYVLLATPKGSTCTSLGPKNADNSGYYVLPATPKGSTCTLLGPMNT